MSVVICLNRWSYLCMFDVLGMVFIFFCFFKRIVESTIQTERARVSTMKLTLNLACNHKDNNDP